MDYSDAWDASAEAADAIDTLQGTDLWPHLPIETRRAICAARVHLQGITAALDEAAA